MPAGDVCPLRMDTGSTEDDSGFEEQSDFYTLACLLPSWQPDGSVTVTQ